MRKMDDRGSQRSRQIATAAALAMLLAPVGASAQSPGVTTRASVSSAGIPGDEFSFTPSLSADGRFVAFTSKADNLVAGDGNGVTDVFVRDRLAQTTERVSVASDGTEGNGASGSPRSSANGRFVAFTSGAGNLVAGDGNARIDVFVHDRDTGETERVSRAIDGGDPDAESFLGSISDDGSLVGFGSNATNLVDDDGNGASDFFVFDRNTGTTERVSVSSSGGDADYGAYDCAISGDGKVVAFTSFSTNLAPIEGGLGIFVRNRTAGTTRRVSVRPNGSSAGGFYEKPVLSRDGRYVAYTSSSRNLTDTPLEGKDRIYVADVETGATQLLTAEFPNRDCGDDGNPFTCQLRPSRSASISADGRFVAFTSASHHLLPANVHHGYQVYVVDRLSGLLPPHQRRAEPRPGIRLRGRARDLRRRTRGRVPHDLERSDRRRHQRGRRRPRLRVGVSERRHLRSARRAPGELRSGASLPCGAGRRLRAGAALVARDPDPRAWERRSEPRAPAVDLARWFARGVRVRSSHERDRVQLLRLRGTSRGASARGEARSRRRLAAGLRRLLALRCIGRSEPGDAPERSPLGDPPPRERTRARAALSPPRCARDTPRTPPPLGRRLLRGGLRCGRHPEERGADFARDAPGSPGAAGRARSVIRWTDLSWNRSKTRL
jgi:Tol biopolymer transport system component